MKSLLPVLALAVMLVGCNNSSSTSSGPSGTSTSPEAVKRTIALIPKGTTHSFWKSVEAGARKAAEESNVELIWKGPVKEDDREEQIKVVEDFVVKKVDALGVAPLDDSALVAPVEAAIAQNIPVLIFDSALKSDKTISFVATDNKAAGKSGGEKLASVLESGSSKKVILLRYQAGSASTTEREEGFLEAAKAAGLEVISDNQFAGPTTESAQQAAENLINRFKKGGALEFAGVFCPNESSTFGMLRALENAGFAGKVKFVGFDASEPLMQAVKDGKIDALVAQDPEKMGYLAVKTLVDHLDKKEVESRIDTGSQLLDKSGIEAKS